MQLIVQWKIVLLYFNLDLILLKLYKKILITYIDLHILKIKRILILFNIDKNITDANKDDNSNINKEKKY